MFLQRTFGIVLGGFPLQGLGHIMVDHISKARCALAGFDPQGPVAFGLALLQTCPFHGRVIGFRQGLLGPPFLIFILVSNVPKTISAGAAGFTLSS